MAHNSNLLLLLAVATLHFLAFPAAANNNLTAVYAFGDSVFDAGNNNKLATLCRANHKPYGVEFPGQFASGRFTDGRLPGDFLVSDLGIKSFLPAYLDPSVTAEDILTGVTFASSCSGYDELTAATTGTLSLPEQLKNFEKAFGEMAKEFGLETAVRAVENAVFVVSGGGNDMMDNYYVLPVRGIYQVPVYHDILISNLENFIKKLKNMGAKRLAVIGLPPLGCLPVDVTMESMNGTRRCKVDHNEDAKTYNEKLQSFVSETYENMQGFKIAYMDVYKPMMKMMMNPSAYGMNVTLIGCCGTGAVEMGPLCGLLSSTCEDPSKYLFFDAAHPTQATYKVLTRLFEKYVLPKLL